VPAKNYRSVTVIVDPADYADVIEHMQDNDGTTTLKMRERLGIKVFVTTSKYDAAIANYLNKEQEAASSFSISMPSLGRLRYGENPHQTAALYGRFDDFFQKASRQGTLLQQHPRYHRGCGANRRIL
jgi:phosphoribosylaminoimidazolecarboxamide formyltransferase/IMP cyclohydrolase